MYVLPQEVEAWYIIPAIRRDLAMHLIKEHKVSYENVGKLLGVTKAAISQYVNKKRAAKIKLHPKIEAEIINSANKIVKNKSDSVREILKILKIIRVKGLHCEICGGKIADEFHNCKQIVPRYEEL